MRYNNLRWTECLDSISGHHAHTFPHRPILYTHFRVDGYREGFEEGSQQGLIEGRSHGMLHGAKLSAEVSFYRGFALTWKCLLGNTEDVKTRKRLKAVESLDAMIKKFPYDDPQYESLQEHMERVRSKFRQVGCELGEKERFWSELDVMESIPTGERVVIGADFNGHVGEGNRVDEEVMGKFGVKERNLEGQMVVYFAKRMDMYVVNTYFQKREEHRVTYKSGDLEKAYDRVPREELWYCMRKSGLAEKYVRVVQDMYERSRTVVRCAVGQTEEFKVDVGLHQGSALSPFLFAIMMDQLESREQVEENLERWRFALERRGMKVSRSKTEYMCVNEREGSGTVRLQGEEVKKVEEFKYLGSTVQSNGECGKE
ncbi:hypothetical protein QTP86_030199, partial [Hemibagrus guttatus]